VEAWEGKAYAYGRQSLREMGCPVEGLRFDRSLVIRGLIMDTELGNLVKADRFGWAAPAQARLRRWQGVLQHSAASELRQCCCMIALPPLRCAGL
jgi:hypothetical protein